MAKGVPVHAAIERIMQARVFLHGDLEDGWAAFWVLSSSRAEGFGLGHIPLSEIAAFADLYNYEAGSLELEELVWAVQVLDDEYLKIQNEKREKKEAEPPGDGKNGHHRTQGKR